MDMTQDLVFVDTNILVYAYDPAATVRGPAAEKILTELWDADRGVLSTQVLQEFYSVATRKLKPAMSHQRARQLVSAYGEWCSMNTDPQLLMSASALCERYKLSWWDALVVEAALRSGASVLLSEDLQDGQSFGSLTVRNPFAQP